MKPQDRATQFDGWVRRIGYASLVMAAPLMLTACKARLDELRLRFDGEQRGTFSSSVSMPMSNSSESFENTAEFRAVREKTDKVAGCGIGSRIYRSDTRLIVDSRTAFDSAEDIQSILKCVELLGEPQASVVRTEGLLWDSYEIRFSLSRRRSVCPKGCGELAKQFPRTTYIIVPGTISRITNDSDILGLGVSVNQQHGNTIIATLGENGTGAVDSSNGRGVDRLSFTIISSDRHYNIDTLLAVLGLVIGSGAVFEGSRRLLRRRANRT